MVVEFNSPLKSLNASEISIRETVAQTRSGIASVQLASDGMSAQITLVGDDSTAGLKPITAYTLSITKDSKVTSKQFEIPNVVENAVVQSINATNRTISIAKKNTSTGNYAAATTVTVPTDVTFDFQEALGRDLTVWTDKNNKVTKYIYNNETVIYDAIEYATETINGSATKVVKPVNAGGRYELATSGAVGVQETNKSTLVDTNGTNNNYAKIVLGTDGKAKSIVAYDLPSSVLVTTVSGKVVSGYGQEVNLSDFTIVKEGKTISAADIKANDVVSYNVGAKFAEVKTTSYTGKIDGIFSTQFSVDGKLFKTVGNYVEDNKAANLDADALKALQAGGDVTVYTDRAGNPLYVIGTLGQVVTNTSTGYLTADVIAYKQATRDRLELSYKTTKNENVSGLDFALSDLETIKDGAVGTAAAKTYSVGKAFPGKAWKVESFKLGVAGGTALATTDATAKTIVAVDSNGNIGKVADLAEFAETNFVDVTKDEKGKVIGLAFDNASYSKVTKAPGSEIKLTDSYINGKSVSASTPVYTISKDGDTLTATTWGALSGFETISEVEVYFNANSTVASYLVVDLNNTNAKVEEVKTAGVTNKALYSASNANQIARLEVYENGQLKVYTNFKKNITVAGLVPGAPVDVTVDSKTGQVIALANAAGRVTGSIDASSVKTGSFKLQGQATEYKFGANTKVYKLDSNGNVDTNASTSDLYALTDANNVEVLVGAAGSTDVQAVVIKNNAVAAVDGNGLASLTSYSAGQLAFTASAGPSTESSLDKIDAVGVTIAKVNGVQFEQLKADGTLAVAAGTIATTPVLPLTVTEGLSTTTFTNTLNVNLASKYSPVAFGATGLLNKDYVTATGVDANGKAPAGTYNVYALVDDGGVNTVKLTAIEIAPVFKAAVKTANKNVLELANNFGSALGSSAATLLNSGAIDTEKALETGKFDIVLTEVKTADDMALASDAQITATPAANGEVTFTVNQGSAVANTISSFKVRIKAANGLTVTKEATVTGTTVEFK